jgi:hypothetical protein
MVRGGPLFLSAQEISAMTTYIATFRTDADHAEHEFNAKTPDRALAKARAFHDEHTEDLMFESYDGGMPVNEIAISGPGGDELAVWRDEDLRLRLAARDLLDALEAALERLEINNLDGEEDGYIAQAQAAIAKAKPPVT